jgi:hypothetical protein
VEVVPLLQRALLALDDQQALAAENEEALLRVLGVVEALRLAGLEHVQAQAELGEGVVPLEAADRAVPVGVLPVRLACVQDEPAFALRHEAVALRDHACFIDDANVPTVSKPTQRRRPPFVMVPAAPGTSLPS